MELNPWSNKIVNFVNKKWPLQYTVINYRCYQYLSIQKNKNNKGVIKSILSAVRYTTNCSVLFLCIANFFAISPSSPISSSVWFYYYITACMISSSVNLSFPSLSSPLITFLNILHLKHCEPDIVVLPQILVQGFIIFLYIFFIFFQYYVVYIYCLYFFNSL